MTVADKPKPGRGRPLPERFEVFEAHPTAHLTEEQKTWKVVKLRPGRERFEVLEQQPTIVLKVHLRQKLDEANPIVLAADIFALLQALSEVERELGGSGLVLSDQRAESAAVTVTLRHTTVEGATTRATKLAEMLRRFANDMKVDPADGVLKLLGDAAGSLSSRVCLILAGSRTVSRCEVVAVAA